MDEALKDEQTVRDLLADFNDMEVGCERGDKEGRILPSDFILRCRKHLLTPFDKAVVEAVRRAMQSVVNRRDCVKKSGSFASHQ